MKSLNSASIPNVRASSGMIGTTREPHSGSFSRILSSRVNAVVVDAWIFSPVPTSNGSMISGFGMTNVFERTTRSGREPSSARAALHEVLVLR